MFAICFEHTFNQEFFWIPMLEKLCGFHRGVLLKVLVVAADSPDSQELAIR